MWRAAEGTAGGRGRGGSGCAPRSLGCGRPHPGSGIVASLVGLARTMGLWVVAEGVEAPGQARWLRGVGCRFAQGFLWSPAVEPHAVLATVRAIEQAVAQNEV
jgi:EAL domain-containing protein (putative c-di-GMP-specific phosphodiesterase class I)